MKPTKPVLIIGTYWTNLVLFQGTKDQIEATGKEQVTQMHCRKKEYLDYFKTKVLKGTGLKKSVPRFNTSFSQE